MVDQGGEVAGIVGRVGTGGDRTRRGEAAMGEGNAGVMRREVRDLLPPAQVIAAQAVGEEEGRAAAAYFIL